MKDMRRMRTESLDPQVLPLRRTQGNIERHSHEEFSGDYSKTFKDDVLLRVIPSHVERSDEGSFTSSISGPPQEQMIARLLLQTLSTNRSSRSNDKDLVIDAIRGITHVLLRDSVAIYEVLNSTSPRAFGLSNVLASTLFRIPFRAFQYVAPPQHPRPSDESKPTKRVVWLSYSQMWRLQFPPELTSGARYRKMIATLSFASEIPAKLASSEIHFDLKLYDYEQHLTRAMSTIDWGWPLRNSECRYNNLFYYCFREVKFSSAVARLREHILSELNLLLQRLNVDAKIEITGLLSSTDFKHLLRRLEDGTVDFDQVLNAVNLNCLPT